MDVNKIEKIYKVHSKNYLIKKSVHFAFECLIINIWVHIFDKRVHNFKTKLCLPKQIDVIDVNEEDVKKFDEATNEVNEVDVFKVIIDKKEYMKKYYEANRDKIIDRTRLRYKLNRNITEKKEPIINKKDYMKNYYKQNKDKIKERSHNRYKIKKEISVFTDKINERHE